MTSIDVSLQDMGGAGTARPSRIGPGLGDLIAAYRGVETSPRWHSQWAWDNYEGLVVDLANRLNLRDVCEIGGGRDPMFDAAGARGKGIDLIINDIDQRELDFAPAGMRKARFDVAGDLSEIGGASNLYDMMISRMVFEHIDGVPRAWRNVQRLLKPGGVGLAFFPTLYAWPFLLNHLIPEKASRALVHALFPNRADDGGDPKFPALYDHCVTSERKQRRMLDPIGFSEVHIMPFWGHGYLDRVPVARELDAALNRLAAAADLRFATTYAFVLVRK
jgi:SAM-dependent methyltransferase